MYRSSRPLINEWLGSKLLRALGFPAAEVACVDLGSDYRQHGEPPHITADNLCDFVPRTGHLASFYPDGPTDRGLYDFLPDEFLPRVSNFTDLIGVLAADLWLGSTAYRQAVFHRHSSRDPFLVMLIDQNELFGGTTWTFAPRQFHYMRSWIYSDPRTSDILGNAVHSIQTLPECSIGDAIRSIPVCWSAGEELALEQMHANLLQRRPLLPALLNQYLHTELLRPVRTK